MKLIYPSLPYPVYTYFTETLGVFPVIPWKIPDLLTQIFFKGTDFQSSRIVLIEKRPFFMKKHRKTGFWRVWKRFFLFWDPKPSKKYKKSAIFHDFSQLFQNFAQFYPFRFDKKSSKNTKKWPFFWTSRVVWKKKVPKSLHKISELEKKGLESI